MKKRFIVEKELTTNTTTTVDTTDTIDTTETADTSFITTNSETDEYYTDSELQDDEYPFKNISLSKYKKPASGTVQDSFTREEVLKKIQNCIPLKTIEEKKILTKMPYFRTWVRYYNTNTKQFRVGGILMKVVYPDYMVLVNLNSKISWSVQLKDVIVYITDPKHNEKYKEKVVKDKLYLLYKQGKLSRKD